MDSVKVSAKFAIRSFRGLPVPEIIGLAIAVLVRGCEPPILGKGRPYGDNGVGDGTVRKCVGDFL